MDWRATFFAQLAGSTGTWCLEAQLDNGDQVWVGGSYGLVVSAGSNAQDVRRLIDRLGPRATVEG